MAILVQPWLVALCVIVAVALCAIAIGVWMRTHRRWPAALFACGAAVTVAALVWTATVQHSLDRMFAGEATAIDDERWNIALFGVDSRLRDDGAPTHLDSISVLSLSPAGGPAVVLTVPRESQDFPLPPDSPLRAVWPSGVAKCGAACQLASVYVRAESVDAGLYDGLVPTGSTPQIEAARDALRGMLGIDVHAFVQIDAASLAGVIDALGGVEIAVTERLPIGGTGEADAEAWIEQGHHLLSGELAQGYVRSRSTTSNADRMDRQAEVVGALAAQKSAIDVLLALPRLADALAPSLHSDLSREAAVALGQRLTRSPEVITVAVAELPGFSTNDWVRVNDEVRGILLTQ